MIVSPQARRAAIGLMILLVVVVAVLSNAWVRRSVGAALAESVRNLGHEPAWLQAWSIGLPVGTVAVSPDGQYVAVSGHRSVQLRAATTGALLRTWAEVGSPHFTPDGLLIMISARAGIHVVPLSASGQEQLIGMGRYIGLAVSGDGRVLAVWRPGLTAERTDDQVEAWQLPDRRLQGVIMVGEAGCRNLAISHDGSLLACSEGRDVQVWRVADGSRLQRRGGYTGPGRQVRVSGENGPKEQDLEVINSTAFSPDGRLIAAGTGQAFLDDSVELRTEDHVVRIWEVQQGTLVHTLTEPQFAVERVAFSPDGRLVAAGGGYHDTAPQVRGFFKRPQDAVIRVWDAASGRLVRELHGHEGRVTSVAFSPTGGWLVSASEDSTVRVWSVPEAGAPGLP